MTEPVSRKDKYGSYKLQCHNHRHGKVVKATFVGALGSGLARHYKNDLLKLAAKIAPQPWAYIADCTEYQASIPEAAEYLRQAYEGALKSGCVGDAYCISSAMGIAQLAKIRHQCGIDSAIDERIYPSVQEAEAAALGLLENLPSCSS
ncbi:hypothetical protein [Lacimicrobium alkaliphilum]|uniref:STAS domain-containing protein n=1 Tax=Lacimicrobium alkaliphilum TaxID=1526571 RepID=A0A0U2RJE0_9ALTE|nr:hypothetical protein [Lacimicrobium alkaliphilum]ALS97354.1 hypothetical protein AT746_03075 [Lacimicrobium alkaliphilum]